CTFSGLNALAGKAALLKAVPVPPSLVVAAGVLSTVITLAINTGVLVVGLAVAGRLSRLAALAVLPVVCLVALAAGVSFLVASAHTHFRDTGLIWGIALQAWFWLTPVVYVVEPGVLQEVLYLNPLARCLHLIRWFLVYDYLPATRFVVLTVAVCLGVLAAGVALFRSEEARVPESL